MTTTAIILAAGASRRLGFPKQLVKVDGVSLVKKTALSLIEAGIDRIAVVTGAWHMELEREMTGLSIDTIHNEGWRNGLGSSIAYGATWALSDESSEQAIFVSTDQWKLSSNDIVDLMEKSAEGRADVVAASFRGRAGIPVLVKGRMVLSELSRITGDAHPMTYLESLSSAMEFVTMEHASMALENPAHLIELSEHFDVTVSKPVAAPAC